MNSDDNCSSSSKGSNTSTVSFQPCLFGGQSHILVAASGAIYEQGDTIGQGGYGLVFKARAVDSGRIFALKMAHQNILDSELKILTELAKHKWRHVCRLLDFGLDHRDKSFIVLPLYGPSLHDILRMLPTNQFTQSTALRVAMQVLNGLEELHSAGFVWRDVKPGNLTIGRYGSKRQNLVRLIDFGLAKQFRQPDGTLPVSEGRAGGWRGTARYCSLTNHDNREQAPRDDIESWLYMIVAFMGNELPWHRCGRMERQLIGELKRQIRIEPLRSAFFTGCPSCFDRFLTAIDKWIFSSVPNYQWMYTELTKVTAELGINFDDAYDWEDLPVVKAA